MCHTTLLAAKLCGSADSSNWMTTWLYGVIRFNLYNKMISGLLSFSHSYHYHSHISSLSLKHYPGPFTIPFFLGPRIWPQGLYPLWGQFFWDPGQDPQNKGGSLGSPGTDPGILGTLDGERPQMTPKNRANGCMTRVFWYFNARSGFVVCWSSSSVSEPMVTYRKSA